MSDEQAHREGEELKRSLARFPSPTRASSSYEPSAELLRSVGSILKAATKQRTPKAMSLFKGLCELAFERIEVDGTRIVSVEPKPEFAPILGVGLTSEVVRYGAAKRT